MSDNQAEQLVTEIDRIVDEVLEGIDIDECESDNGWWETSMGAKFGAERKALLKERLRAVIEDRA